MRYELAWECELGLLEEVVKEMIKDGWVPQGGVAFCHQMFIQAMVKHDG